MHEMKRRLDEERRSVGSDHPPNIEDDYPSRHISRSAGDVNRDGHRYFIQILGRADNRITTKTLSEA